MQHFIQKLNKEPTKVTEKIEKCLEKFSTEIKDNTHKLGGCFHFGTLYGLKNTELNRKNQSLSQHLKVFLLILGKFPKAVVKFHKKCVYDIDGFVIEEKAKGNDAEDCFGILLV